MTEIAFSNDSTRAASVSEDGTLAIWDTSSLQPLIPPFKGHMLGAHAVAFSADGRRLATGSSGREAVKLWDVGTRQELLTLRGAGSMLPAARWSADGDVILAGAPWQAWRAPSWEEIAATAPDVAALMQPAVCFDAPFRWAFDGFRVVHHRPAIQVG